MPNSTISEIAQNVSEKRINHINKDLIVAIGASAGGLEAVTELLHNLSPETGMIYVYIQHLDPTRKSLLSTILSKTTQMKVLEAEHLMRLEPNHFYIIPPNKDMALIDGLFTLKPRELKSHIHLPIDHFFTSLAQTHEENAIGIILSGTANDGTLGLKAIKAAGGITFAQDTTAKFSGMPVSAVTEDVVDKVLPPALIAKELEHISEHYDKQGLHLENDGSSGRKETEIMTYIIGLIKKVTGVDFTYYKKNTIRRRILRRMLLSRFNELEEYAKHLSEHSAEANALCGDLLINVTNFFRDEASLEYIKKNLLPVIVKNKKPSEAVRIWIPACSTGQEAFSYAMILSEFLSEKSLGFPIQIFATDLSKTSISKARMGIYTQSELNEVPPQSIHFFTKTEAGYRISKTIRDMCVFAPHNIFKDPPFSRMDIISCCNLLIYMEPPLQKKILTTFHYALRKGGYLVLGKSESAGAASELFTQLDKKNKIFIRKENPFLQTSMDNIPYPLPSKGRNSYDLKKNELSDRESPDLLVKAVDKILDSKFTPASVVVNEELDILQFRGSTGLFIEPTPGKASLNLLKMARQGLSFELRTILYKARKSGKQQKKQDVEIQYKGVSHFISIQVFPLKLSGKERFYLIVFEDMGMIKRTSRSDFSKEKVVKELREENIALRDDMSSILEEKETNVEELQSANEEIVSSNEELQSINEELETSKEEIESSNEELRTINQELQTRNDQLAESLEYSETILSSIAEAVLILDNNLRIKSANRSFYRIFNVTEEETRGRLLYELGNGQWNISVLREKLEDILSKNTQINEYEIRHIFPTIGEKIMLLKAWKIAQKTIPQQSVFLSIQDITEQMTAVKIITEREQSFRSMADNAPVMIWRAGADKQRDFFNKTWLEYTGRKMDQELGMGWLENVSKLDQERFLKLYNSSIELHQPFQTEYRLKRKDGEYRWVLSNARPIYNDSGTFNGILGTCTEMHDQKKFIEEMEQKVQARMNIIIEDILTISTNGPDQLNPSTDLEEIIRTVMSDLNEAIVQKKVQINLLKLPVVKAGTALMKQLFYNLINNTLKFSSTEHTPIITITSRQLSTSEMKRYHQLDKSFCYSEIVIEDNGVVLSPHYNEHNFIIFGERNDKDKFRGGALDLAISRKIVSSLGGHFYITSKEGQGTFFHIILPLLTCPA